VRKTIILLQVGQVVRIYDQNIQNKLSGLYRGLVNVIFPRDNDNT